MATKHRHIKTAGNKPTSAEIETHEIVINEADGLLWTKDSSGNILQVGGAASSGGSKPFMPGGVLVRSSIQFNDDSDNAFENVSSSLYPSINNGMIHSVRQAISDTNAHLLLDVSGKAGVLTHVMTACNTGSGSFTIQIQVDGGDIQSFAQNGSSGSGKCLAIGGFVLANSIRNTNYSYSSEASWYTSGAHMMVTPSSALKYGIGIPFTTSIKVWVTTTGSIYSTNYCEYAGVSLVYGHYFE